MLTSAGDGIRTEALRKQLGVSFAHLLEPPLRIGRFLLARPHVSINPALGEKLGMVASLLHLACHENDDLVSINDG